MAAGAAVMHLGISIIDQRRRSGVAAGAGRRAHVDQGGMVRRRCCMGVLPGIGMTCGAVAAGRKGLACCQADQGSGSRVMAAGTSVMHLRVNCIGKRRRIGVTVSTAACAHPYYCRMIRRCCVNILPSINMARRTVAAGSKGLANRQADPVVVLVMAAGAGIMHLGI